MKRGFVYIITNCRRGTLYVGVTRNLAQRIQQHKDRKAKTFTKEHGLDRLVYYEVHDDIYQAIRREKQIKKWRRSWKLTLIEDNNPFWDDLFEHVLQG